MAEEIISDYDEACDIMVEATNLRSRYPETSDEYKLGLLIEKLAANVARLRGRLNL